MQTLRALDATTSLSYITTLAYEFIPSHLTERLSQILSDPKDPIYENPNDDVRSLF